MLHGKSTQRTDLWPTASRFSLKGGRNPHTSRCLRHLFMLRVLFYMKILGMSGHTNHRSPCLRCLCLCCLCCCLCCYLQKAPRRRERAPSASHGKPATARALPPPTPARGCTGCRRRRRHPDRLGALSSPALSRCEPAPRLPCGRGAVPACDGGGRSHRRRCILRRAGAQLRQAADLV